MCRFDMSAGLTLPARLPKLTWDELVLGLFAQQRFVGGQKWTQGLKASDFEGSK
jgi:hypothetical protein